MSVLTRKTAGTNLGYIAQQQQQSASIISQGLGSVARTSASVTENLSRSLSNLSGQLLQRGNQIMVQEAKEKATADVLSGKTEKVDLTTIYGQAYNSSAMATYNAETHLNAKIKAQELAQQYIGDPEGFKLAYGQYEKSVTRNAPNEESRVIAQRYFKGYRELTSNNLLKQRIDADNNRKIAVYQKKLASAESDVINQLNTVVQANRTGDVAAEAIASKAADEIINEVMAHGHTLVNENIISETERMKLVTQARARIGRAVYENRFVDVLQNEGIESANAYLQEFSNEIPDGMDAKTHAVIVNDSEVKLSRYIRNNRATQKATLKQNDKLAKDAIKLLENGITPQNYDELIQMEFSEQVTEDLNYAINMQKDVNQFNSMTIPEQEAAIAELKSVEPETLYEVKRLNKLQTMHTKDAKMAREDSITLMMDKKIENNIVRITADNMDGLKDRPALFDKARDYFGVTGTIFSKQEASELTSAYNSGTTEQKQEMLQNLTTHLYGDYLRSAINEISGKKNDHIRYDATMTMNDNDDIAQISMMGANSDIPAYEGLKIDYNDYVGTIFKDTDGKAYNMYLKGATNFHKGKKLGGEDLESDELFEASVGKITDLNGRDVLVPVGKTISDFEDWVETVEIPDEPALTKLVNESNDFFGSDVQLQTVGYGKYSIILNPDTAPMQAADSDGNVIILDWMAK